MAASTPKPIGAARDYARDVAHAQRFAFFVGEHEVESLAEAAIRFVMSKSTVFTALVGMSNQEQLEEAVVA